MPIHNVWWIDFVEINKIVVNNNLNNYEVVSKSNRNFKKVQIHFYLIYIQLIIITTKPTKKSIIIWFEKYTRIMYIIIIKYI